MPEFVNDRGAVPVFTAFPLAQPAIAVSATQSRKAARQAGFKISLPGVSGAPSLTAMGGQSGQSMALK